MTLEGAGIACSLQSRSINARLPHCAESLFCSNPCESRFLVISVVAASRFTQH